MIRLAVILLIALIAPALATQTQQGIQVMARWKAMDVCQKKAQEAFPDFTAASVAKRDAQVRACLEGGNLPSRAPLEPPR
jgi:hypothetical protein